jgi:O-antigen/teichoic acid export membrane protein
MLAAQCFYRLAGMLMLGLLAANVARSLLLVALAVIVTRRRLCPLRVRWDTRLLRQAVPFLLLPLVGLLGEKVATLALGFLGDYRAVGHYQLAMRIVAACYFVPGTVAQVLFPQFSAQGLTSETRRTFMRILTMLGGLGVLAAVIASAAAPLCALLYGPAARAVAPLLHDLALLFPLRFLCLFLATTLPAFYQERQVLRGVAAGTAAGLMANSVLIPTFGAHGAAYAQMLSEGVQLAVLGWYTRRLWLQAPDGRGQSRQETGALAVRTVRTA